MQVLARRSARSQGKKWEGQEKPGRAFKNEIYFALVVELEDYLREQKAFLGVGTQKHIHLV